MPIWVSGAAQTAQFPHLGCHHPTGRKATVSSAFSQVYKENSSLGVRGYPCNDWKADSYVSCKEASEGCCALLVRLASQVGLEGSLASLAISTCVDPSSLGEVPDKGSRGSKVFVAKRQHRAAYQSGDGCICLRHRSSNSETKYVHTHTHIHIL